MYFVQIFKVQLELHAIIYVVLPFFFSRVNYIIDWMFTVWKVIFAQYSATKSHDLYSRLIENFLRPQN